MKWTELKLKLALWLIGSERTVVPSTTLAACEAQMVVLYDYITLHSGRLNDGTTRPVRKKLKGALQVILGLMDGCYEVERSVGKHSAIRETVVPSGL